MTLPRHMSLYDDFLAETGPDRLQKILARYELFKLTLEVPGDIAECGVFKGSGLYTWVKLMTLFKPNNEYRVVGFDFFGTGREFSFRYEQDQRCLDEHAANWASEAEIQARCERWGFRKLQLYAGNVVDTTRRYATEQLGARLSLLYIDVDNYEGARACLENLYPLVSPGGLIVFDEYALPGYGESDAVDEFLRTRSLKLRALPWANTPTGYIVKDQAGR